MEREDLEAGIPIQRAVGLGIDSSGQPRPIALDSSGNMLVTHTPSGSSSGSPSWGGIAIIIMGIMPDGTPRPLQVDINGQVVIE